MHTRPHYTGGIRLAAVVAACGLSLCACATKSYVRDQIRIVNTRVTALEAKTQDALQRADAAGAAAQSAASTAQAASAAAQAANQGVDQLAARVDAVDQLLKARKPRN